MSPTDYVSVTINSPDINLVEPLGDFSTTVVIPQQTADIISIAEQGPTGISEDELTYAKRVDFINDNLLYKGEATVGSLDANASWRIRKITIASDNDISETWADGVDTFNKVWDNRLSYIYS